MYIVLGAAAEAAAVSPESYSVIATAAILPPPPNFLCSEAVTPGVKTVPIPKVKSILVWFYFTFLFMREADVNEFLIENDKSIIFHLISCYLKSFLCSTSRTLLHAL